MSFWFSFNYQQNFEIFRFHRDVFIHILNGHPAFVHRLVSTNRLRHKNRHFARMECKTTKQPLTPVSSDGFFRTNSRQNDCAT